MIALLFINYAYVLYTFPTITISRSENEHNMLFKALFLWTQPILSDPLFASILHNIANTYLITVIKKEIMCDISTNQLLKIFIEIPKDRNIYGRFLRVRGVQSEGGESVVVSSMKASQATYSSFFFPSGRQSA